MIRNKKSKHYRRYIDVGRVIATAKEPITAGPEIKYLYKKKKGEKKLYMQHIIGTSRNLMELHFKQMV